MSEDRTDFNGQDLPVSLEDFKNKACGLGIEHSDFVAPTPEEIKVLRKLLGFSQVDLAKFVGVSYNIKKGSATVRRWETVEGGHKRKISLFAWQLMLIKAGLVYIAPVE